MPTPGLLFSQRLHLTMADSRAPGDPYTLDFEATVQHIRDTDAGPGVVLDETYFYPAGGGQPADRGTLAGFRVEDVRADGNEVVHVLDGAGDGNLPKIGTEITCGVDSAFRTYCMRAHTASHALYGAGRRLLDNLGYGGFDIGEEKVRVDLSTPTDVDDGALVELERLTNRAVWDSRSVSWETQPKAEALSREDVAFNTKTAEGITGETVRIVTIDGWDVAACGGTHVRNTREIGPVTVHSRSNPGEGLTRVEFSVGPTGIRHRSAEKDAALEAAAALGTSVESLPGAVERLKTEREELAGDVAKLTGRLVEARVAALREETVERNGQTWMVGTVPGIAANDLADHAGGLAGDAADVVALVGPDGSLAVGTTGNVNANEVVETVTGEFGGGGGGSPTLAQAGGFGATAEEIVSFLRSR